MKKLVRLVLLLSCFVGAAAGVANAQSIVGTVRDDSGAVMPGVTVEAASPSLLEKVRTVVTDGAGQYSIQSLVPGTYTVTFSLPGFSTVIREGVVLNTGFTATVDGALKVGSLEETITVSGASPIVDLAAVGRSTVLTREIMDALPTARNIQAQMVLMPGVTTSGSVGGGRDVGGNTKLQQPSPTYRGANSSQMFDGYWLHNLQGSGVGGAISFYTNNLAMEEVSLATAADNIASPFNGLVVNNIPKDGGNQFHGAAYGDISTRSMNADNLSDKLRARGITDVARQYHNSDVNFSFGGPIKRDKLWFFVAYRYEALDLTVVDNYYDKNPAPYIYEPDLTQPAHDNGNIPNKSFRVAWQASAKDKITGWGTMQNKQRDNFALILGLTPDALAFQNTPHGDAFTTKWSRTQTSRLLFEGGYGHAHVLYIENYKANVQPVCDMSACTSTVIAIQDIANGRWFNAYPSGYSEHGGNMGQGNFSASYVTGSHAIKAGTTLGWGRAPNPTRNTGDVQYRFNSGTPNQVTLLLPRNPINGYYPDLGLFAQDQWRYKNATITGGLRFDYYVSRVYDGTLPASRWAPATDFEGFVASRYKDISPRIGIAYDLRGDGRTALKASFGRYLAPLGVTISTAQNQQLTIGNTDTRTWVDRNGDFGIFNADGSVQLDELGPTTNVNFGKVVPSNTTTDQATLFGWHARPATVEFQTQIAHELTSKMSASSSFYVRNNSNQLITDNTLVGPGDFDGPFCVTGPSSPDLPGGGGQQICGLYDLKPVKQGQTQENRTFASNFGGITDRYTGVDLMVTTRLSSDTFMRGGFDLQRRLQDNCNAPQPSGTTTNRVDSPENRYCKVVTPFRPDFKFQASTSLPWDLQLAGTYQNSPGTQIVATWLAPNSVIAPALGRNLAAGLNATKSIQLIQPGTVFAERLNQLDLRLSKRIRIGRYTLRGDMNVYNVFNDDFVPALNTNFSTTAANQFLRPTATLLGRTFKFGGQLDF